MTSYNVPFLALIAFLILQSECLSSTRPRDKAQAGSKIQSQVCEPTTGRLDARATLAGREGRYLLTLVQLVDNAESRRVRGALILLSQPPGLDSMGSAATPLYGFTDIDLRTVGAHRVGDPAGTDPEAPGVLVLESVRAGNRSILLRVGADANKRDSALFDGAYTALQVRQVDSGGFAGTWRSRGRLSRAGGYFCARRAD